MTFAPMALGIAGGAFSALGAIVQGHAHAESLRYQAQVARNNAIYAAEYAKQTQAKTQSDVAAEQLKNAANIGSLEAAQAASGVTVKQGSAGRVVQSQKDVNQLNAENVMNKGQWQAYGYRIQGAQFTSEKQLKEYEAPQAELAGDLGALGALTGTSAKFLIPSGGGGSGGTNYVNPASPFGA